MKSYRKELLFNIPARRSKSSYPKNRTASTVTTGMRTTPTHTSNAPSWAAKPSSP